MRRREFITLVGFSAVAWPIGACAQQTSKVWRVGMLETTSETLNAPNVTAFRRGLQQLGYVEGQNLIIEYRSGEGRICYHCKLGYSTYDRVLDVPVDQVGLRRAPRVVPLFCLA